MDRRRYAEPRILLNLQRGGNGTPVVESCAQMGVVEAIFQCGSDHCGAARCRAQTSA